MLTSFWRYVLVNNSGQLLTYNNNGRILIYTEGWYIDPATGLLVYDDLGNDDMGFIAGSTLADGAEKSGGIEFDNTANKYLGAQVQLRITHDEGAAADGTFDLYIARGSTSGLLMTELTGYSSAEINKMEDVGSLVWDDSPADDDDLISNVWEV